MTRLLGRSGIEVSALGMGCWAIGGPLQGGTDQYGWGPTDDAESIRAIQRARELGITFFDTASNYGAGHSERLLGQAVAGSRDDIVIATKWGYTFDEKTREATGEDSSLAYIRSCLHGSLRRLGTDYIDLYQLHLNGLPVPQALDMIGTLEELVEAGVIRAYGWSTDDPASAAAFAAAGAACTAIQHDMSVLNDAAAVIAVCEEQRLASINRGPLAMGLLSGKYHDGRSVGAADVRSQGYDWLAYFRNGAGAPEWLARVDAIRGALTADGRSLVQGALGWLWTRSEVTVPIPGFRTVAQVEENAGALAFGPLPADQFAEVQRLLTA
ncbi:aryl-alcohol dehydrogenase-like predicted oxidoreductase [Allocatelliglobosispora scoriae]|uniref:Aryl-alcohol dehydrogenase-like predicted oxidoreductase n=2 Tax=Allocatelliglobosispora scoriae TaxID=643052 RepID=A0A841BZQ4_9ACTN|nr:aryl-alcohol dehydrogenase-like predicted oxidoreductase [Allocatelliglobosispora scoriae]